MLFMGDRSKSKFSHKNSLKEQKLNECVRKNELLPLPVVECSVRPYHENSTMHGVYMLFGQPINHVLFLVLFTEEKNEWS